MTNGKGAKRQRQKEQRRTRIEQQVKAQQAQRRRRMVINLTVLALILSGVFYYFNDESEKRKAKADRTTALNKPCSRNKPATGNTDTPSSPPPLTVDKAKTYTAVIETSCGTLEAELAADISPNTVNSFIFLAKQGFYNGLKFHRIAKDFAVQGGDPKGDGTGGPNYKVVDAPPADFKYARGAIAMAKAGPEPAGTAGSQFFIVPGDSALKLTPDYAVLGKVVKGADVVAKLDRVKTKLVPPASEKSTPVSPVYIVKVTVRES